MRICVNRSRKDALYVRVPVDQVGESILALKVRVRDIVLADMKKPGEYGTVERHAKDLRHTKIIRQDCNLWYVFFAVNVTSTACLHSRQAQYISTLK